MKRTWTLGLALLLFSSSSVALAGGLDGTEVGAILRGGPAEVDAAISRLREEGPGALDVLFAQKKELQEEGRRISPTSPSPEVAALLARLDSAIDRVGGAKYCSASQLYWYTDLEQAKAVAQKCGKPILTLRMLGNLTDEFSCANSRFFRTTLYSNEEISRTLRERFVLHWRSVRPVPKVTIDFGDGRKLERTLTGNSIHYVLMPDGQVVDAIPGLYGPKAFLKQITRGEALVRLLAEATVGRRNVMLANFHQQQASEVTKAWQADWQRAQLANVKAGPKAALDAFARTLQSQDAGGQQQAAAPPRAEAATRIARPKERVEARLVEAANLTKVTPEDVQDEKIWNVIASFHSDDAKIDVASRRVIREEKPLAAAAGRLAMTKRVVEDPMLRLVANLENSIAVDTVKNEYQFHRKIHQWLAAGGYRPDVETLNERVYAEIFLTPSSDPWLGLAPANVYTALENGGVVQGGK
ncbi:MAG: hypothetical protein ACKVP0_23065 [Pirellulaceae bacterium]